MAYLHYRELGWNDMKTHHKGNLVLGLGALLHFSREILASFRKRRTKNGGHEARDRNTEA